MTQTASRKARHKESGIVYRVWQDESRSFWNIKSLDGAIPGSLGGLSNDEFQELMELLDEGEERHTQAS